MSQQARSPTFGPASHAPGVDDWLVWRQKRDRSFGFLGLCLVWGTWSRDNGARRWHARSGHDGWLSFSAWRRRHDSQIRAKANWLKWWPGRWSLTLIWVVGDRPRSLMYITKGRERRQARSAKKLHCSLSPGVEYRLINYLTYVSHPESGTTPFWASLTTQHEAARSQSSIKTISGQS